MATFIDSDRVAVTEETLRKSIHQWGCAVSEASLEPGCLFFTHSELMGFIGYRIESKYAIVYGDPICPPEMVIPLASAFIQHCKKKGLNTLFFIVSDTFAKWACHYLNGCIIQIGEEFAFNPQVDFLEGHEANRLRNYIRHAKRLEVKVKEYIPQDIEIEIAFDQLKQRWLECRKGPQVSLGKIDFFETRSERRWFYLQDNNDEMIGAAMLCRLDAKDGWLLKYSMALPTSPRGSSELLVSSIFETLAKENCQYLTYGLVASNEIKEIYGVSPLKQQMIRFSYKMMNWMFRLSGRQDFWKKFRPIKIPRFAVFNRSKPGLEELKAIIRALNVKV